MSGKSRRDITQVEFPVGAGGRNQFRAAGKKFWRAALIRLAMGAFVANHAVVRAAEMSERERIGRGAVEDEKNFAVLFENLPDAFDDATGPFVVAIGDLRIRVRSGESGPRWRTDARGVITRKVVTLLRRNHRRSH